MRPPEEPVSDREREAEEDLRRYRLHREREVSALRQHHALAGAILREATIRVRLEPQLQELHVEFEFLGLRKTTVCTRQFMRDLGRQAMTSVIEGACWTMAAALAEREVTP